MIIYDSHQRKKVPFEPIKKDEVRMYVCGPTVYDDAHLGHARSSISFDLLRRTLEALGYKVTFVKNFTDIDDKIINKMNQTGKSLKEITEYYIDSYLRDMDALNVKRADIEPKATESLDAMFDLIDRLLEKGYAYKLPNGDIYFDTSKDEEYCRLSNKCQEDEVVHRVDTEGKKNPADFALWKACKGEGDVCFDSPYGKGRPGWHIECSAMIKKHIAYDGEYEIDIHGGGADLFFPHHENEEAQSHCAYGGHLAKYWMHNGFVQINGEKMSKSLGNSFFVKDALKHYPGEVLRFYLMSTHYRAPLNFSEEDLIASKKRLDKLYRLKKRVYGVTKKQEDKEFQNALLEAMKDDLNISKALAVVDEFVKVANEALDKNPKDKALKQKIVSNIEFIDKLLGVGGSDAYEYFQAGIDEETKAKINELIEKRSAAKKEKNFELADKIRDELKEMGIMIQDTPNGTVWEKV
ncbi:cysteine--tRNA ligase [Caminibacter pacificus]|uniref:Cysteine--tRNA ligase n=1 Tax=Caminibacter pacificus TaxID=1424653 RepID=A0AAJ4UYK8_9BACT|nr:cysteine--tRNA ligase [Caminibacter pacificus]QCI28365.1 cysteine--tRNA ligase [Caminibacter pacificus]ROR40913.1 cysteinyl-tRNA synthetase [Caminibacter pacificus]